jgi:hypothetical protein
MTKRGRSKTKAQKIHAKLRAAERYNLLLSSEDLKQIIKQIQSNRAIFLERQSLRVTKWEVTVKDQTLCVIYDRERHSIVTILPQESEIEKQEQGDL